MDTDEIFSSKMDLFARIIQESKACVVYSGAGISTAAGGKYSKPSPFNLNASLCRHPVSDTGIDDYATRHTDGEEMSGNSPSDYFTSCQCPMSEGRGGRDCPLRCIRNKIFTVTTNRL